jgi:hypothetical protein
LTRKGKIWLIVAISAILLFCCCIAAIVGLTVYRNTINTTEIFDLATSPGTPGVTLANYDRVQYGMTYPEVVDIFGGPGVRTGQMKIADNQVKFYSWKGAAGGEATITFSNGVVMDKESRDLK